MPSLVVGGGTIPVGSRFRDNLGAGALTSAPETMGSATDGSPPPNTKNPGVALPAFAGQWYPVPDNWVFASRDTWNTTFFGKLYNGSSVQFDPSEITCNVPPRDIFTPRDTYIQPSDCQVRLTKNTAGFLLDGGLITQTDFANVTGDKTPTQKPPTVTQAITSASNALTVLAIAAAAIYFLPRLKGG